MPDKRTEPGKSTLDDARERARKAALIALWTAVLEATESHTPEEIRKHVEIALLEDALWKGDA